MAVKGTCSVTIFTNKEIQAVWRYYLLRGSTMSAPTIDDNTVRPPTTGGTEWTAYEPAFSEGTTNSLYFTDCMVFTDGSISYSEVSKSTSYEAAKEAYSKANSAQIAADAARNKILSWCHENNETLIDGAKIYTGSIDAESINVESLTADAVFIDEMETNLTRFKAVGENEYYETEITGEGIDFKYGTSEETAKTIAGISGDELQIKKTSVLDEMKIGKWSWKVNPNNSHLTLRWNGGDE